MNAPDIKCATCFFWQQQPDGRYGECRRDAPVVKPSGSHGFAAWPLTMPLDWCGEHALPVAGELPRFAGEGRA